MKMAIKKIGYSKYLINTLGYGASLACIQSIAWIVVTSMGLYFYYNCPDSETVGTNLSLVDFFNVIFRNNYYTDYPNCYGNDFDSNLMVTPFEFLIWNYVYLVFSAIWLLLSAIAIINVNKWDTIHKNYYYAILWVIITIAICILDVILGALLARDIHYRQINQDEINLGSISLENVTEYVTFLSNMASQVVTGVVFTIVFRGFVIWIMNLAFAVYVTYGIVDLIKAINEDQKNHIQHNTMSRGPISAYDNSIEARSARWLSGEGQNMNRPHLTPPKTPSMYGRSDSSYQGEYNQGYVGNNYSNHNSYNRAPQPVEAIPTRRSMPMPWERDAPSTPKPDYSPQPIRSIRSALKPVPHTKANNYMR